MNRLYYFLPHALLSLSSFLCHVQQTDLARMREDLELFNNDAHPHYFFMKVVRANQQTFIWIFSDIYDSFEFIDFIFYVFQKEVIKSRNKDLVELFEFGMGIHHAGMLRADRALTEKLFSDGLLKVELIPLILILGLDFQNLLLVSLSMPYGVFRYLFVQQLWHGVSIYLLIQLSLRFALQITLYHIFLI